MQLPAAHQELLRQLKDERSKLQDLVWELDDIEVALADLEAQYSSEHTLDPGSMRDLEALRLSYDRMEEAVLQQMLYIDRLQERLDTLPYSTVRAA